MSYTLVIRKHHDTFKNWLTTKLEKKHFFLIHDVAW